MLLPLSTHLLQSSTSATTYIPGAVRVLSRGSRKWLSWQLYRRVDPPRKGCPGVCVAHMLSSISPQTFRDTVPSTCWVLWQPFAVSILSLQICCLFSPSAKSKQRDCSDMPTDVALLPQIATPASKPNTACNYLNFLKQPFDTTIHSSISDTKITHCFICEYKNVFSEEIK